MSEVTTPVGHKIALDCMGGDLGPAEVVAAVKLALRDAPALAGITLVGDEAVIDPLLREHQMRNFLLYH